MTNYNNQNNSSNNNQDDEAGLVGMMNESKKNMKQAQARFARISAKCLHQNSKGDNSLEIREGGKVAVCTICGTSFSLANVTKEHFAISLGVMNDVVQQSKLAAGNSPEDLKVLEGISTLFYEASSLYEIYDKYCGDSKKKKNKNKNKKGNGNQRQNYGSSFFLD